ncbi:MAG: hypothetical protein IAF58_17400 [Leptolyngbya sp.]|nr:hypothetical protein [Candidatus Melainabacteria bacterium]
MQGSINGTSNEPKIPSTVKPSERLIERLNIDYLVLGFLALLELITFGPFVKQIGFYLDDWLMLNTLHFGPQDLLGAFSNYFISDPKVIIRPIEVLHFGAAYFLFGNRPLGYHLLNGVFEIACAALLYFAIKRFSRSRLLAFLTAFAYVSYPIRDSTHYWILCSSVSLSLAFYLTSFIYSLKGAQEKKWKFYALSAVPFLISIYNYEVFMPLAGVSAVAVFLFTFRTEKWVPSLKASVISFLPLFLSGCSLFVYQRFIVPKLGVGYLHMLKVDPQQILHVISSGAILSSPFNAVPFFQSQVALHMTEPFTVVKSLALLLLLALGAALTYLITRREQNQNSLTVRNGLELGAIGLVAIITSLSIFGLNKEYEPTLMTLVNRIFTGAAFGWSCIFAGVFAGLLVAAKNILGQVKVEKVAIPVLSLLVGLVGVYFTVTNWQLAQPWIASWRAQNGIYFLMKKQKGIHKSPDTIILTDCPRYVMWSPVFDGIWDFQSMTRLALEDPKIKAGVVSERLEMGSNEMKDMSMGYTCATYPYERLFVFVPDIKQLLPVENGKQFVDIIEKHGEQTRLASGTLAKWRVQLSDSANRSEGK